MYTYIIEGLLVWMQSFVFFWMSNWPREPSIEQNLSWTEKEYSKTLFSELAMISLIKYFASTLMWYLKISRIIPQNHTKYEDYLRNKLKYLDMWLKNTGFRSNKANIKDGVSETVKEGQISSVLISPQVYVTVDG